mmetsp:Transcript_22856/g.70876  ORF Transcript_22856/g.70876 Transcript_22856/m.70876 type:complete len:272 (-) Transcript_22856:2289-3104(-)
MSKHPFGCTARMSVNVFISKRTHSATKECGQREGVLGRKNGSKKTRTKYTHSHTVSGTHSRRFSGSRNWKEKRGRARCTVRVANHTHSHSPATASSAAAAMAPAIITARPPALADAGGGFGASVDTPASASDSSASGCSTAAAFSTPIVSPAWPSGVSVAYSVVMFPNVVDASAMFAVLLIACDMFAASAAVVAFTSKSTTRLPTLSRLIRIIDSSRIPSSRIRSRRIASRSAAMRAASFDCTIDAHPLPARRTVERTGTGSSPHVSSTSS